MVFQRASAVFVYATTAEFLRDTFLNVGEEAVAVEVILPAARRRFGDANALAQEQPLVVSTAREKRNETLWRCVVRLSKEKERAVR